MTMICIDGVPMPKDCHECDSFGISDLFGIKCPCYEDRNKYDFEKRPERCPLYDTDDLK